MTIKSDYQLDEYATDIARDIARDASDIEQAFDWAHESADGSEHVVYTYKAHALCQACDVTQGREFVSECYPDAFLDYDQQASVIAYGELLSRIEHALNVNFEQWKEAAQ